MMLFGYDPVRDLPDDHLARLVEAVVEAASLPRTLTGGRGQPAFDPRLCAKVLLYGYATGVRSSRQLERLCNESLPYLFLTRGDAPTYRTLCSFRVQQSQLIEDVWLQLFAVAGECDMKRVGRIVIDSSKFRADAGPEAVVKAKEYDAVLAELRQIVKEADEADARDEEDPPGTTRVGQPVETEQMRDILRRVRKKLSGRHKSDGGEPPATGGEPPAQVKACAPTECGPRMLPRIKSAIAALETAKENALKHICLTDPDARMMGEGREKGIRECHCFEVVVDAGAGLLVAGQSCQSNTDNSRLEPLVEAAQAQEPEGIKSVDADSGYYSGDSLGRLIARGIDTCIPDSNVVCDLHRGEPLGATLRRRGYGSVPLEYDAEADLYRCPQGKRLLPSQRRITRGQDVTVYRAEADCTGCTLAADCLCDATAKRRTVKRGDYRDVLEQARQHFADPAHQERYRHRAEVVETVFGFLRSVLGYGRWSLRGKERVACEARLFKAAYQLRKIHGRWSAETV